VPRGCGGAATLRAEQSAPITIRAWAHRQRALPESSLAKAIGYMLGLSPPRTLCHDVTTCRLLGSL
jgi:hypothetical protein